MAASRDGSGSGEQDALTSDPRWALTERVCASSSLQRAPRLRELLRYLCECAIRHPQAHITEQQVGVAVFEKPVAYDTNADTIVRVLVSQLRRKVEHYFLSEGRDEPIVIELPKGSYLPVFRARADGPPAESSPARRWTRLRYGVMALGAVLAAGVIGLAVRGALTVPEPSDATPFLGHLWRQFIEGRDTQVVPSDASVTMLSELLGRPVTLSEYSQGSYPQAVMAQLALEPTVRATLEQAAVKGFTNFQDVGIAHAIARMCERYKGSARLISARDVKADMSRSENVVLLGHPRTNPWMELFEGGLNFRYRFDVGTHTASIVSGSPKPGEEASYAAEWGRKGYSVVAYLPKARGQGNVLLIFGTDWVSVSAGGQFISDETSVAGLHRRMGIGLSRARIPHFEVLLQADLAGSVTTNYRVLAHRLVPPREREK